LSDNPANSSRCLIHAAIIAKIHVARASATAKGLASAEEHASAAHRNKGTLSRTKTKMTDGSEEECRNSIQWILTSSGV